MSDSKNQGPQSEIMEDGPKVVVKTTGNCCNCCCDCGRAIIADFKQCSEDIDYCCHNCCEWTNECCVSSLGEKNQSKTPKNQMSLTFSICCCLCCGPAWREGC